MGLLSPPLLLALILNLSSGYRIWYRYIIYDLLSKKTVVTNIARNSLIKTTALSKVSQDLVSIPYSLEQTYVGNGSSERFDAGCEIL